MPIFFFEIVNRSLYLGYLQMVVPVAIYEAQLSLALTTDLLSPT
jgi:hypothetical protein